MGHRGVLFFLLGVGVHWNMSKISVICLYSCISIAKHVKTVIKHWLCVLHIYSQVIRRSPPPCIIWAHTRWTRMPWPWKQWVRLSRTTTVTSSSLPMASGLSCPPMAKSLMHSHWYDPHTYTHLHMTHTDQSWQGGVWTTSPRCDSSCSHKLKSWLICCQRVFPSIPFTSSLGPPEGWGIARLTTPEMQAELKPVLFQYKYCYG